MAFDLNDLIRLGRKFLPQFKKWWKKRQQQQQQQQQQDQQQQYGGPQQSYGQNPYGQQPHGQQQAWGGGGGGGGWNQQQGSPYPPAQGGGGGYAPEHHYQPTHQFKPETSGAIGPHHPGHQVERVPLAVAMCRGKGDGRAPSEVEVLILEWLERKVSLSSAVESETTADGCRRRRGRRRSPRSASWSRSPLWGLGRTGTVISVFPLVHVNRRLTPARSFSTSCALPLPRHHPSPHPPRKPPTPPRQLPRHSTLHPLHPANPDPSHVGPVDPLAPPPMLRTRPPISLRPPSRSPDFIAPPQQRRSSPFGSDIPLPPLDDSNLAEIGASLDQPPSGPTSWLGVLLPFRIPTVLLPTFRRHPHWLASFLRAWFNLPRFLWPKNQDQLNASNAQYVGLRNRAIQESEAMGRCFDQSKRAYSSGDGARAKELSNEGHAHQREKDRLNHEAAEWIFSENNKHSPQGTVDLHGLFVQEAISYTEQAVQRGQQQGLSQLKVITGKGNHSVGHVAKIKPAIEDLMRKYNLSAHIDPHNTGVLIVDLSGRAGSRDAGFADQMANGGDQCVVM